MQFSDTTQKNGIIQIIEKVVELGVDAISGNVSDMAFVTELVNKWSDIAKIWARKASGSIIFDDANQTDLNILTASFVDKQDNYSLDESGGDVIQGIRKVEIHDVNAASSIVGWNEIGLIETPDIPEDRFGVTAGTPYGFWVGGRSLFFYPRPATANVDKYRLNIDRAGVLFTVDSTDKDPGIMRVGHWILVYGPAMELAKIKGKEKIALLCEKQIYGNKSIDSDDKGLKGEFEFLCKNQLRQQRTKIRRKSPRGGSFA